MWIELVKRWRACNAALTQKKKLLYTLVILCKEGNQKKQLIHRMRNGTKLERPRLSSHTQRAGRRPVPGTRARERQASLRQVASWCPVQHKNAYLMSLACLDWPHVRLSRRASAPQGSSFPAGAVPPIITLPDRPPRFCFACPSEPKSDGTGPPCRDESCTYGGRARRAKRV
jgi:hypothetical protein